MENSQNFTPEVETEPIVSAAQRFNYMDNLSLEQNLPMGIAAGLGAAIVGGILWALLTIVTGYQIGYMAIAVGFIVGYAVRYAGKGLDNQFGIAGASLAVLGCLLGNYFSVVYFVAQAQGWSYFQALSNISLGTALQLMVQTSSILDLLFYGLALYEGFKFSFRQVIEEEIMAHYAKS